jgi:hypothetical protein
MGQIRRRSRSRSRPRSKKRRSRRKFGLIKENNYKIEAMADSEGCWNKVLSFMEKSEIFTINGEKITSTNFPAPDYNKRNVFTGLKMRDNCKFVSLGDTIDNGPNNFAVLRLLRYLKSKYRDRVVLILGNRDINKLRLKYELVNNYVRPGFENDLFIKEENQRTELFNKIKFAKNTSTKLRDLLINTFGIRDNLENIKTEIKSKDDMDVVRAYKKMLSENGDLTYLLKNGQLIYYDKPTKSIYVHGSVNCTNFLLDPASNTKYSSVTEWVNGLNKWSKKYINLAYNGGSEDDIEPLIKYQEGRAKSDTRGPYGSDVKESVIYSRPWDTSASVGIASTIANVCAKLVSKSIQFIVIGHSPVGQFPVIIKGEGDIATIACDTTYTGIIGNVSIVKNDVIIKAKYDKDAKLDNPCKDLEDLEDLKDLEYKYSDHAIGKIIKNNGKDYLVAAKFKNDNNYVIARWESQRVFYEVIKNNFLSNL